MSAVASAKEDASFCGSPSFAKPLSNSPPDSARGRDAVNNPTKPIRLRPSLCSAVPCVANGETWVAISPFNICTKSFHKQKLAIHQCYAYNNPVNQGAAHMVDEKELLNRITFNPKIFGGKPIIAGRRLAVEHVLGMLAAGDSIETILEGYPWLEHDDVRACIAYAHRIVEHERIEPMLLEATA